MKTKTQNYSNHPHYVPLYHFLTFGAMLFLIGGAIYCIINGDSSSGLLRWLFLLLVLTVISVSFHCRSFALRAQDRAIRSEENLRYFILTGRRLNQALTMGQIIALRFASDEEFVELADVALRENLTRREIKKRIRNWRPDYHRA